MAARMQAGNRPGGARFAQFKLVLLGTAHLRPLHSVRLTQERRISGRKELARPAIRESEHASTGAACDKRLTGTSGPIRRLQGIDHRRSIPDTDDRTG